MKGRIPWENLFLTIFLWIFVWQLYDMIIEKYKINLEQQTHISIIGIIIILYIIYIDKHFK